MKTSTAAEEIIDLSDGRDLSEADLNERHAELDRVVRKIDALKSRQETLLDELGLVEQSEPIHLDETDADSILFLDETLDAFAASPPPTRPAQSDADFDINDVEFDERFAAFASTDSEGDHKARRWFHKA